MADIVLFSFMWYFFFLRVIKQEEGKKLADSWGAAFMESSAKENEVQLMMFDQKNFRNSLYVEAQFELTFSADYRLLSRFLSGSFWKSRKLTETRPQRRRSVL